MTFRTAVAALTFAVVAPVTAEAQQVVALSEHDQRAYGEAYAAIDAHNWAGVTRALAHVDDTSLVESVRGRMLASPNYRASYGTLKPDPLPLSKIADFKKAAANLVNKVGFDN